MGRHGRAVVPESVNRPVPRTVERRPLIYWGAWRKVHVGRELRGMKLQCGARLRGNVLGGLLENGQPGKVLPWKEFDRRQIWEKRILGQARISAAPAEQDALVSVISMLVRGRMLAPYRRQFLLEASVLGLGGGALGVGLAVGVGLGVPPPIGAWIATVMGDPVLKKPTVALTLRGG